MSLKDKPEELTVENIKGKSVDQIATAFQDSAFHYTCEQIGMNDAEYDEAKKFIYEEHAECRKKIKPCAGYSYGYKLSLTPLNLGTVMEVECTICKKSKDVTDVGGW